MAQRAGPRLAVLAFAALPLPCGGLASGHRSQQPSLTPAAPVALPGAADPGGGGCQCIDRWQAYERGNFTCGQGEKFSILLKHVSLEQAKYQRYMYCANYFKDFTKKVCRNTEFDEWTGSAAISARLCDVTEQCYSTQKGHKWPGDFLHWSFCDAGEDQELRKLGPIWLHYWCLEKDFDLSLTARLVYPTWKDNFMEDVEAFWNPGDSSLRELSPELAAKMKEISDSRAPMVFLSRTGAAPFAIVKGPVWFQVQRNHIQLNLEGHEEDMYHPGTWFEIKCVHNCEPE